MNFISSKDIDEEHIMHLKSDNIEIMSHDKADKVIEELFESLLSTYQIVLKTSMKSSNLIFDCLNLLHQKYHKINLNHCGLYIDSTTRNLVDDDKFFQYAATVPLKHEEKGIGSQRISKIKPFINKYNWKVINYSSGKDDWRKFDKNNPEIALNVFYVKKNEYISYLYFKT